MNKSAPPIPDKKELFCSGCRTFYPRARIVSASWRSTGQPIYWCAACAERRQKALAQRKQVQRGG